MLALYTIIIVCYPVRTVRRKFARVDKAKTDLPIYESRKFTLVETFCIAGRTSCWRQSLASGHFDLSRDLVRKGRKQRSNETDIICISRGTFVSAK